MSVIYSLTVYYGVVSCLVQVSWSSLTRGGTEDFVACRSLFSGLVRYIIGREDI